MSEAIRCYGAREMELLAEKAGFSVRAHLANTSIGNPDYIPDAGEPRGDIILVRRGQPYHTACGTSGPSAPTEFITGSVGKYRPGS